MMDSLFKEISRYLHTAEFYVSLPFWGYLAAAVLVYRLVPGQGTLKSVVLLICNACMLLALPRFSTGMLGILFGMCVLTYIVGSWLNSTRSPENVRTRVLAAGGGIVAVLCLLVFFKYPVVQEAVVRRTNEAEFGTEDFIFLIGISYSSFKAMHFIIEGYKRTLQGNSFLSFLNFIFFFPGFISGPINRYNHFVGNSAGVRMARFRDDLYPGARRIVDGLFKKTVLTAILAPYTLTHTLKGLGVPIEQMTAWQVLVGLTTLALYFYFDFSGYTDLAIGSARLMGFVLPENFNRPFLKKNIQQFWANWHMSLTSWLTDYIYWPLVRKMRNDDFWRKRPILVSNIAILVTFLICGVWHGESFNFVLWGLYHGIGISTVNTYQSWKRKVRYEFARKYFTSKWSYGLGTAMTFGFFAIGQSLFFLDAGQAVTLIRRLISI